jgi:histone deacetylase complex regulatory component SIN3
LQADPLLTEVGACVRPEQPKKIKHTHKDATPPPEDFAVQEPAYTAPANPNGNLACPDEIAFFERVKKYIENKDTYHEFLKLLNLFVQDIIDSKVLVERAYLFIGQSGDIWNQFRGLIGDDQAGRGGIQGVGGQYGLNGSGGILGAGAGLDGVLENTLSVDRPRVDLNSCKAYGASYRKLPKEVRRRAVPSSSQDRVLTFLFSHALPLRARRRSTCRALAATRCAGTS